MGLEPMSDNVSVVGGRRGAAAPVWPRRGALAARRSANGRVIRRVWGHASAPQLPIFPELTRLIPT